MTPDAGEGTVLGYDVIRDSRRIKAQVGYMTQKFSFYEDLTIEENLFFVARLYDLEPRREAVARTLEDLGLASRRHQLAGTLSGGWKQRLALAACIMHKPKLLLLDEPTAGVDPKARREFWDEIHRLAATGLTVLVSTHYMDEAERCHRISYISYGHMLATGTVEEVVRQSGLVDLRRQRQSDRRTDQCAARPSRPSARSPRSARRCMSSASIAKEWPRSSGRMRPRTGFRSSRGVTSLEDVFIHFMSAANGDGAGEGGMIRLFFVRLGAVLAKEFVQMRRDRITFAMMLGVPVLLLILFGYAINTDPKRLDAALLATGQDHYSRAIISALEVSDYYRFVARPKTDAEAEGLIQSGAVAFLVIIPSDFGARVDRGDKPQILIEADATDPAAASNAIGALDQLASRALLREQGKEREASETQDQQLSIVVHRRYNPDGISQYFIVPGLLGVILQMTMVMMTSIALTREIERGTMENLLAMPANGFEIMLGKVLPFFIVGAVQVTVILSAARFLFHVPFVGNLAMLLSGVLVFVLAMVLLGYTFSTLARSQMQAMQLTFFFLLPSILMSGFMFPFHGMPDWAQDLGSLLPMTHFLRVVRAVMLKGANWSEIGFEFALLTGFVPAFSILALLRFRRTLD